MREALGSRGEIEIEVKKGVVILERQRAEPCLQTSRRRARLVGAGSRDVVNGIAVEPPEEDAPIAIEEAVRIALDKDPFVDERKSGSASAIERSA